MNNELYQELNNELFAECKEKDNHKGKPFIDDGIINPELWFSEKEYPKILFVLKEAYGGSYSLTENLSEKGPWSAMWNRIAEWSYGLLNASNGCVPEYKELDWEEANMLINRVVVMNLRKSNGEKDSSDKVFAKYGKDDAALLKKQFDLIDPDIVVYGYTFDAANCIHGLSCQKKQHHNDHWFYKDDSDKLHIDFFHPANHYPALLQYYGLMGIYQKAIKDK